MNIIINSFKFRLLFSPTEYDYAVVTEWLYPFIMMQCTFILLNKNPIHLQIVLSPTFHVACLERLYAHSASHHLK